MATINYFPAASGGTVTTSGAVSGDGSSGSPITIANDAITPALVLDSGDFTVGKIATSSAGSVNAPQLKVNEPNTGLYAGGGDLLGIAVAVGGGSGQAVLRVPTGGIGTFVPSSGGGQLNLGAGALANNAAAGHVTIPTCPGTPTGTLANLFAGWAGLVLGNTDTTPTLYYSLGGGTWVAIGP